MKAIMSKLYNSGLKLINHLIYLICIAVVRQILLDLNCCKWLSNYIQTLTNHHIQSPLVSKLIKIKVRAD